MCNIWGRVSLGKRVSGHVMGDGVQMYMHAQAVLWWNRQLELRIFAKFLLTWGLNVLPYSFF